MWPSILSQIEIIKLIDSLAAFFLDQFLELSLQTTILLRERKVNHKDLFFIRLENEYIYSGGWNYKAVYAVLIGFIFSFSIIWNTNFEDFKTYSWIIGFVVSYIMYYLLNEK